MGRRSKISSSIRVRLPFKALPFDGSVPVQRYCERSKASNRGNRPWALDLLAGLGIDLGVFDPVAGVLVDLVESNFVRIGCRGKQRDRAGDERQMQEVLPVRAGAIDQLRVTRASQFNEAREDSFFDMSPTEKGKLPGADKRLLDTNYSRFVLFRLGCGFATLLPCLRYGF